MYNHHIFSFRRSRETFLGFGRQIVNLVIFGAIWHVQYHCRITNTEYVFPSQECIAEFHDWRKCQKEVEDFRICIEKNKVENKQ
jgi:hypothetical protein